MKTYRKIIAILLAVGLVLPGAGLVTFAEEVENVHRLAGADRYKTAVAVSEETYKGTADAVVLAGGMAEVDALTGTLLAAAKNAPLLYTDKKVLTAATKTEIAKLAPTTVYVLGGKAAVEEAVVTELKTLGYTVKRVEGLNRQATAAAVAEEANFAKGHAFIVRDGVSSSLVDALAVAPASYKMKSPVFLTKHGALHPETKEALKGYTSVTVIGGETAVSKAVETELTEMGLTVNTRVAGLDRDKTAVAIANKYFAGATQAVLANGHGKTLVDALVGGYLGGMKDAPVLYTKVDQIPTVTADFVEELNSVYMLGGTTVMSAALETAVGKLLEVDELKVVSVSAINAKELQVVFNQPIKKSSVIDSNDELIAGIMQLNSVDARTSVDNAYLSKDGKTLTLVANTTWSGSYAAEIFKDKVEATNGKKVLEFKAFVSVNDTTRPTFIGLSYEPSGEAKFSFSEPLNETNITVANKLVVSGGTSVAIASGDITIAGDNKSFTVTLPATMTKDASYTFVFTGLQDFAGNLLSPNPLSTTVVKSDRDTVKPTVTNVVALDTGKLQVTFSEKIQPNTAIITVGGADYSTYTLDTTGTIATFTGVTNLTAGVQTVVIKDALDLAGLKLEDVTRVIQVTADTTAPAYVNHTVETVGADRFLVVNYNEEITVNNSKSVTGTYVDSNSITHDITPVTAGGLTLGTNKQSVRIKLPATAGTYTLNLPVGLVEDTSAATNDSAARSITISVGAPVDTTKPAVLTYVQSGNKITVTFDRDVTAATALNVGNYTIDGISSPFESAIFKGDASAVELTLKNDVISTNGFRNYTVRNVATAAGAIMELETDVYDFKENVRPTVLSAKVISATEIEVTLSEAIKASTVGYDFDVFQGTSTTPLVDSEAISGTNKVVITLTTPLESLTGLSLKASTNMDLTDLNGNVLNFVGPLAVTN